MQDTLTWDFNGHPYALIDRAAFMQGEFALELPMHVLVPPELEKQTSKMPGLLSLYDLPDGLRTELLQNCEAAFKGQEAHCLCCLLEATSVDSLQKNLLDCLIIDSPQGRTYLRYYDPRVFRQLQWILKPEQIKRLFGPVTRWTLLEAEGFSSFTPPSISPQISWWAGKVQREQIDRVGLVNETLGRLNPGAENREARSKQIDAVLACASARYALDHDDDLLQFAWHAMQYGVKFHEQPEVRHILATISNTITYSDLASRIEKACEASESS